MTSAARRADAYRSAVIRAALDRQTPAAASPRFASDVRRVRRHLDRENRTGIIRNLHIAVPRTEVTP